MLTVTQLPVTTMYGAPEEGGEVVEMVARMVEDGQDLGHARHNLGGIPTEMVTILTGMSDAAVTLSVSDPTALLDVEDLTVLHQLGTAWAKEVDNLDEVANLEAAPVVVVAAAAAVVVVGETKTLTLTQNKCTSSRDLSG